jgi:DNA polymerase-3 subunit beta
MVMRVLAPAATLAGALDLAASLIGARNAQLPAFAAARLVGGNSLTVATGNRESSLSIMIEAEAKGEFAVAAQRLADLVRHFDTDAEVTITATDRVATVAAGQSRFRLPTVSLNDLPSPLALEAETGRVELGREAARDLFQRTAFALATDKYRYYLNGTFLCDAEGGLAGVATDGRRLARIIVPAAASLSNDARLIVPAPAVKAIGRLLASATGTVVLRRSDRLFEITAGASRFVTKLIDGTFPECKRIIPTPGPP